MLAILDERAPREALEALLQKGYRVLQLPPSPILPAPVNSHPDMLLFFAPDRILCTQSYKKLAREQLRIISAHCQKPIEVIKEDYGACYPDDVLLNALAVGEHLFCNTRASAEAITAHPLYRVHHVNQGYAKCNALPVGPHALITSDASIASAASKCTLDVLCISPGDIRLSGYPYGFIGGCASYAPYASADTILFCGSLESHPDAKRIRAFCNRNGLAVQSLGAFPLTDVGTVFLI